MTAFTAYVFILSAVTVVCEPFTAGAIPILIHGYDYPVPDGRGYMGGWGPLPGPWLEPGFREKGYGDLTQRVEMTRVLIDRFNDMLAEVAKIRAFAHVRYVDLRNTLSCGADYKKWWANEMHPTEGGFGKVTGRFAAVLGEL
ncbi:hypothetical protein LPW11_07680 [Geomonas sp. RF6]|uniref:hypothetical protein n=1 Tax=Geomonas sp. RF6 TaxID=2897342 RepID=UPI001E4AB5C9|nr:hypothetical protein [Geomonas sp. RF6]UFS72062.1 hypothetical protein LPW11_07680 [Geomonas sp. RF6]